MGSSVILIAVIQQPSWLKFVSRYPIAPNATITLLDQDGIVIARTLNNDQWVGGRPATALYENSHKTPEGAYRSAGLEGQRFYSAHSRSKLTDWTVATEVPQESVEQVLWSLEPPAKVHLPDLRLNCRVLVAEDRPEIRYLLRHFVEKAGGKVIEVADGKPPSRQFNKPSKAVSR